jgi:hypothetical protein
MHQLVNGSHFGEVAGYFEWWYFHFASASGFAANIVLHETDIFGLRKSPYVSMSYQLPHREPQYLRMAIPDESITRSSEYLSQLEGLFAESDSNIEIRLSFPSGETFEVAITKLAEPLILNNCVLYHEGDKRSYWRLQVPFGRFNGILKAESGNFPIEGVVYHDHQWGNISIQDFVSDWVWGHFSSNESSAVFFAIQTKKGDLIERYAVVSPSSVQSSIVHGQVPHLEKLVNSGNPELWSGEPVVTFPFGATLRTRINPNALLRSRVNEAHGGFVATYLRWAGDAIVSPPNSFHYGITEYIRIRKED